MFGQMVFAEFPLDSKTARALRKHGDVDQLLPVQYYDQVGQGRSLTGELRLFYAILEDALRSYVKTKNCQSGLKRAEFRETRKWFYTRGIQHVFSFESVCAYLDLDPDCLRAKLDSLRPSDLPLKHFSTRRGRLARPSRRPRPARTVPPRRPKFRRSSDRPREPHETMSETLPEAVEGTRRAVEKDQRENHTE